MLRCMWSRRRSRKRCSSRVSSGQSSSWFTGKGSVSAVDSTRKVSATTSMSPVAMFGFTVSAARATTAPVTVTTYSLRARSASAKHGLPGFTTTWVMP